jgi:hypothetical protein
VQQLEKTQRDRNRSSVIEAVEHCFRSLNESLQINL